MPALQRQMDLLLAAVEPQAGRHPDDLDRIRAVATGADPADRSRR